MKIKVKKRDTYIPEWNGNADEKEPIKVHFRFLTAGERSDYVGVLPVKLINGEPEIEVKQDNAGLAKAMIERIENLELEVDGRSVLIDDAKKLYNTEGIPDGLVKDIEGALAARTAVVDTGPLD